MASIKLKYGIIVLICLTLIIVSCTNYRNGNIGLYMPSLKSEYSEVIRRNKVRIDHLRRSCEYFKIRKPINNEVLSHIHLDTRRKILYCFVPKVACTSWKRIWMKLTGVVPPTKNITEIKRFDVHVKLPTLRDYPYRKNYVLKKYRKFMFVRHPFERVVSAFRDKLEHQDLESGYDFRKEIGTQIEKMYRGGVYSDGGNITFNEFIQYISEPGRGTFEQRNEHWLSVHDLCNPCAIQYDFIGNFETLDEDANYILDWIGARNLVDHFPKSDRPFNANQVSSEYLSRLTSEEISKFISKYIYDYLPFKYDF